MKIKEKENINRDYIVKAKEIKKALNLKGDILAIGLYNGRSQKDIELNISTDNNEFIITTKKVIKDSVTNSQTESKDKK